MPTDLIDFPPVLKIADVSRILAIGRRQTYKLVTDGTLRSVRLGRSLRVPKTALIDLLDGDRGTGLATTRVERATSGKATAGGSKTPLQPEDVSGAERERPE
jgi:excisionase family DNA binding protein